MTTQSDNVINKPCINEVQWKLITGRSK